MKKEISLKMIKQAFDAGVKKGDIDSDTAASYYGKIQNFVNNGIPEIIGDNPKEHKLYNPKFWKGSYVDQWFETLKHRYHNEDIGGSYVIGSVHAFSKLQDLVSKDKVWKGVDKVRVGLKGSIEDRKGRLYELHQEGISMTKAGEVTSMKPKGGEFEKILDKVKDVIPEDHRNYQSVVNVLKSQRDTGGRITAECNLKVGDIDLEKKTKKYDKDKNDFTRRTPLKDSTTEFYKQLVEGKAEGTPLFPIINSKGKQLNKKLAGKYVQEVLKRAADMAGVNVVDSNGKLTRYTSHSNRRGFGQQEYNATRYSSKKEVKGLIADYVNLQGSNKEGILKRIEDEKLRLNYYNIKNNKPVKDFSWEQLRRLYVSLQMGHSRIDHIKRYIDTDAPIWNRK